MKANFSIMFILLFAAIHMALRKAENDIHLYFQMIGMQQEEVNVLLKDNLIFHSFSTPSRKLLNQFSSYNKTEMVEKIGSYMKQYFNSNEVKNAYLANRESMHPAHQELIDVKTQLHEMRLNLKKTEEEKKHAPIELQSSYNEVIQSIKQHIEILSNPKHPEYNTLTGYQSISKEQEEELNKQIEIFNTKYPEDIDKYIQLKLVEFLNDTKDIDFNAKLINKDGKLKFENPNYETKSYVWKKCFRMGKETTFAARKFAIKWLQEINTKLK